LQKAESHAPNVGIGAARKLGSKNHDSNLLSYIKEDHEGERKGEGDVSERFADDQAEHKASQASCSARA